MNSFWHSRYIVPTEIGLITILCGIFIIMGVRGGSERGEYSAEHMCSERPWSTNFTSRVFSAGFFDVLCEHRGLGATTTQPHDISRIPWLSTGSDIDDVRDDTTAHVQITAHPQRIPSGARTGIYWATESVVSCEVRGPGVMEGGLSGFINTPTLRSNATYTIECTTKSGTKIQQETQVDVQ